MLCSFAQLDEKKLEEIKKLEESLHTRVIAYTCHESKPAQLDRRQQEELQRTEQELGMVLVAVQ